MDSVARLHAAVTELCEEVEKDERDSDHTDVTEVLARHICLDNTFDLALLLCIISTRHPNCAQVWQVMGLKINGRRRGNITRILTWRSKFAESGLRFDFPSMQSQLLRFLSLRRSGAAAVTSAS